MHNFLSRFRRGSSSATVTEDHKKSKSNKKNSDSNPPGSSSNISAETYQSLNQKNVQPSTSKSLVKTTIPNQSKNQQITISLPVSGKKPSLKDKKKHDNITEKTAVVQQPTTSNEDKKLNVFGMIIDPIYDGDALNNSDLISNNFQIFDPEPAPAETNTSNHTTFIDDKYFIFDDEDRLSEISQKIEGLAKENNVFTINEVPEGRLSRLSSKSSRASSVGSSGSTRASSNVLFSDQQSSDNLSTGQADSEDNIPAQNGSKNILLDALIKKFNVNMDLDTNDNGSEKANTNESVSETSGSRISNIKKVPIKYHGEEHSRKQQSELQRKINRTKNYSSIADSIETNVDATSSFDDDPKRIKIMKSSSTQITRTLNKRQGKSFKTVSVTRLPQNFECKYIGKTRCTGLWGLKHIRDPVDYLVNTSRQLRSLDGLPNVEALISEKGIYIVQKTQSDVEANLKEAFSPILSTNEDVNSPLGNGISGSTDDTNNSTKYYQSGLLPISNISYAVQDNVYGKVFSCIIVRECEGTTISECYSFLCRQNEIARRMALSITLAFKEYGKLLQLKETRINRKIEIDRGPGEKGDSFV